MTELTFRVFGYENSSTMYDNLYRQIIRVTIVVCEGWPRCTKVILLKKQLNQHLLHKRAPYSCIR